MKLTITIDLDNAAFSEGGAEEVARILASVAERIPDPLAATPADSGAGYRRPRIATGNPIQDSNGNTCGSWRIDAEGGAL